MSIEISRHEPESRYEGQKKFSCGHPEIDRFVRNSLTQQVKKNLSVAYVLTDSENQDRFVGFLTLAQHTLAMNLLLTLQLGSLPRLVPCTRLVMLVVDQHYQRRQLGSKLIQKALQTTKEISELAGCYGLYLDAESSALDFIKNLDSCCSRQTDPLPPLQCSCCVRQSNNRQNKRHQDTPDATQQRGAAKNKDS